MSRKVFEVIGHLVKWVALGLFIASQVNKAWFVSGTTETGLYEICSSGLCFHLSWNPNENLASFTTRITLIVAAVFISGGIIANVGSWCVSGEKQGTFFKVEGSLDIVGGVLTLGGMIAFTAIIVVQQTINNLALSTISWYLGWSYSMCWASGVIFIVAGVFEILAGISKPAPVKPVDSATQHNQWATTTREYQTSAVTQPSRGYYNSAAYNQAPPKPRYHAPRQSGYRY